MDETELSRTSAITKTEVEHAKAGLKKLLKEGRVSLATVLGCPELIALPHSPGSTAADDGAAATAVAQALRLAIENMKERDAIDALFGLSPLTEGESLRRRRARAAALLGIKPESFRVRRESQLLDKVARGLVVELAEPQSGRSSLRVSPEPRLFVVSSSDTKGLVDALSRHLSGKATVVSWAQSKWSPSGVTTLEAIGRALDETDFAVFVLSDDDVAIPSDQPMPGRSNVMFEFGLAVGRLGITRTFLLVPKNLRPNVVPTDLAGISIISYEIEIDSQEDAALLASRLWREIRALGPRAQAGSTRVSERGDTGHIEMFADAVIGVDTSLANYPDELRRASQWGERVPAKLQFAHAEGGRFWLRLCRSVSYRYFQRAKGDLRRNAAYLAEMVGQAAGTTAVDLISLGCGDGSKDDIVLQALARELGDDESLCYYPVEISDILLVEALRHISRSGLDRSRFRCKAILGDFTNLQAFSGVFEYRPSTNLFSVLGNTIGSFDEPEIFASLGVAMLPGDLVLIEANIGHPDESVALLEEETAIQWDLSTLDALGLPHASYELGRELREDVSTVPGTETLIRYAVSSAEARGAKYMLYAMHHYDFDSLKRHVESELNVKLIGEIVGDGVGFLLGQRSP
jgi:predicted nucleotide-binding protein